MEDNNYGKATAGNTQPYFQYFSLKEKKTTLVS